MTASGSTRLGRLKIGPLGRRYNAVVSAAVGALLVGSSIWASPATAAPPAPPPACANNEAGIFVVTADCVDPNYSQPVVDLETDVTTPVPLHKVSGHFVNSSNVDTGKKFNIYLPPKKNWDGRFFQYVYPLDGENATDLNVSFGAASGAFTLQTNGGSGYRVDAAAAKFAKTFAANYYGTSKKIYGYVWGGSGGSFQVIGAAENTTGVWAGAVPFILGTPSSIPNTFLIRAFARLALHDKAQQIGDAVRPGGSGNPYKGLTEAETAALHEVTSFGVPLRGWEDPAYLLGRDPLYLLNFMGTIKAFDPGYADAFWSQPGYLGTEQSPLGDVFRAAKVDQRVTVTAVGGPADAPTSLVLADAPANPGDTGFEVTAYQPDGVTPIGTVTGLLDPATKTFTVAAGNNAALLGSVVAGSQVRIDNRWEIAVTSYHRHQVPGDPVTAPKDLDYSQFNQFRNPDGTPRYPQRRTASGLTVGALIAQSVSGGAAYSGNITTKMILVDNRLDLDAHPIMADWYAKRVQGAKGKRFDDTFRIWYQDNADHQDAKVSAVPPNPDEFPGSNRATRLVGYFGVLQQALRDVSEWAEKGSAPPKSTPYSVKDNQIVVKQKDAERGGVQPVVDLSVGRSNDRIDVVVGQKVTFKATITVPPKAGKVVATDWDFLGMGTYTPTPFGRPRQTVDVKATFTYSAPGTYFPSLRVGSERNGDTTTPFAVAQNLDRVQVVVH